MQKSKFFNLFFLTIGLFFTSAFALADSFNVLPLSRGIYLGQTDLDFSRDPDAIHVGRVCGLNSLQLTVIRNDAQIDYLLVRFGNGHIQQINVRDYFVQGSTSRFINLDGQNRCVEEIFVQGRTRTNGPRSTLIFTGFRHEIPNDNIYLGQTRLEFGHDVDAVHVSPLVCGLNSIQLTVRKNDAQIDQLIVRFGNGEAQRLIVRDYFRQGTTSRHIDLDGRNRCIQQIFVEGRTRSSGGEALLVFTGRRF